MEGMITYTGTKKVKAIEVTKRWYCDYRGWNVPEGEDPEELIYLVEYAADPLSKPNHNDHEGYITMSPKHVFDKAYKVSETYLDRLKIEHFDLAAKVWKLEDSLAGFMKGNLTAKVLKAQLVHMLSYLNILTNRIDAVK